MFQSWRLPGTATTSWPSTTFGSRVAALEPCHTGRGLNSAHIRWPIGSEKLQFLTTEDAFSHHSASLSSYILVCRSTCLGSRLWESAWWIPKRKIAEHVWTWKVGPGQLQWWAATGSRQAWDCQQKTWRLNCHALYFALQAAKKLPSGKLWFRAGR